MRWPSAASFDAAAAATGGARAGILISLYTYSMICTERDTFCVALHGSQAASGTAGAAPSTVAAIASPSAAECLKPCPEHAETTVTEGDTSCARMRNIASGV